MPKLWSQKEANPFFPDVPNKTQAHWLKLGLVQWEEEEIDGRGLHRHYSIYNLYQFAIVRELAALNLSIDWIKSLMEIFFFLPTDIEKAKAVSTSWEEEFPDFPDYLKYDSKFHQKPVWEKTLILFKLKSSMRIWEHSQGGFLLCDLDNIDFIIKRKPVAFTVVHLPTIIGYVHDRIKEVEESANRVPPMTVTEKVAFIEKHGLKGFKQYLRGDKKYTGK